MPFDTLQYWIFFAAVLAFYGSLAAQNGRVFLVVASLAFYGVWDIRFVALLGGSIIFNYLFGRAIELAVQPVRRRWLVLSIAANLAVLGVFKYLDFLIGSVAQVLGLDPDAMVLTILLPVGVSFFTFEGIAYSVDVYRQQVPARHGLVDFALFMSFFPHLVAGPIIRPADFFPQVGPSWRLSAADFKWGVIQIVKGLTKKCVFADACAVYANAYFAAETGGPPVTALVGVLAFGMQIYFDFAGYTDIARGCARLLGFSFPPNFERPYLASNISEFWRRWHISLSSWLRDYLYIPLGGNRKGSSRTYGNYLVVMGLGGLWHGASWNFLIWGLFHGSLLAAHRFWLGVKPATTGGRFQRQSLALLAWMATTTLVFLGWIPFRARDWQQAAGTFAALFQPGAYRLAALPPELVVLTALSLGYCLVDRRRSLECWLERRLPPLPFSLAAGVAIWILGVFMQRDTSIPFIYFQF